MHLLKQLKTIEEGIKEGKIKGLKPQMLIR